MRYYVSCHSSARQESALLVLKKEIAAFSDSLSLREQCFGVGRCFLAFLLFLIIVLLSRIDDREHSNYFIVEHYCSHL
jgi:hypothetical protein